ncbi:MAG: TRAFAC clade GTPase domain-containing protein [Thermoguttaceae bacterium]
MTKAAFQQLESSRLVEYSIPVPCYICEAENTPAAEFCHRCLAPMALTHQANSQNTKPRMVAVMGASGVGKTVYLGMLMDMLSRQPDKIQMLARGAFSITLQQNTIAALVRCAFPHKTPNEPDNWNWVHCQIRREPRGPNLEMLMPDMAGEAILEEVEHPHSYRIIGKFLKKSMGVMLLIDAAQLKENSQEQDFFGMKLLSYLSELDTDPKHGWITRPVALILTKVDCCEECWSDPDGYARVHASGLWRLCQERFHSHRFFAAGVAGACLAYDTLTEGRLQFPLRIEPHGIVEPFQWIVEQLENKL